MTPRTRNEEEASTAVHRKQSGCSGKQETNSERCRRLNRFYQGRYPDVPALGSRDFVRTYDANSTVLVDVRTVPERNVSKLEGAVSLQEFEERASSLSPETKVVTYCTIGYRSGMEARRLQDRYALEGRISSLDGIVAYTHALANEEKKEEAPKVVNRMGSETSVVHTFGRRWDCVHEDYNPQHFPPPVLMLRYLQVGGTVVWRTVQRITHRMGQCFRSK
jgi:rhodanese-related sulfurtransferase